MSGFLFVFVNYSVWCPPHLRVGKYFYVQTRPCTTCSKKSLKRLSFSPSLEESYDHGAAGGAYPMELDHRCSDPDRIFMVGSHLGGLAFRLPVRTVLTMVCYAASLALKNKGCALGVNG